MRILVRGTNWIGDAVMTIPAITKLRRLFPEAHIAILTPPATTDIFKESRVLLNDVIPAGPFLDQVRRVRRESFDLAVIFPNSFSSAAILRPAGIKRRFGYDAQHRGFLLTDPVPVPEWKVSRHEVHYYLNLIGAVQDAFFGTREEVGDGEPRVALAQDASGRANKMLAERGIDRSRPMILLAAGSTNSRAKRWTPEGFALLNEKLQLELGATVVLMGSKDDREISGRIAELSNVPPIDLTGETDIALAGAILREGDLLISNDMGLAHLAPAVGTKTIVLFGPTNPVTTRPFSPLASVISANVECAPCMLRDCPIDHRCMTRISADDVYQRAVELLNE